MPFTEMTLEQSRHLIDIRQIWSVWAAARHTLDGLNGSMVWRTSNGHEYLTRFDGPADQRRTRSLGPRSPVTETILDEYTRSKDAARDTVKRTAERLKLMARVARALQMNRVPLEAAKVLRVLHRRGVLGQTLSVVGTNAIYAYEAAAAAFVATPMLATVDLDVLFDARRTLKLQGNTEPPVLMEMLRFADRSYARSKSASFSANTKDGYAVDLIKPTPHDILRNKEKDSLGDASDLQASHIPNMRWIESAPRFEAVAIGEDGLPVPFFCPDPRAFALYKLWMSTADDRDPTKRGRDRQQAYAVAALVNERFPLLPFVAEHVTMFPKSVVNLGGLADFLTDDLN